jgi:hypothetical protein
MYKIDKNKNNLIEIEKKNFSDFGFRERDHLQEWLVKNPQSLGEDLLVIQKEFSGFTDTNERLDILALDKSGCLVVIENKLDDSGKDVTWQALKYVSYCSTLKKEDIREIYQKYLNTLNDNSIASEKLSEFFEDSDYDELELNVGNNSQRVILVAANFRKEVTSTVLWLINFEIKIKCFKVSLHAQSEDLIIFDINQIIPTKEVEDYMISMADKVQVENQTKKSMTPRRKQQTDFWAKVMEAINKTDCSLFKNRIGAAGHWIGTPSQIKGASFNFAIYKSACRVEFYIDTLDKELNTKIFNILNQEKEIIEESFGNKLKWDNKETARYAAIRYDMIGGIYQTELWEEMVSNMVNAMIKLERTLQPYYKTVSNQRLVN